MTDTLTPDQRRLVRDVDMPDDHTACWPWTAATTRQGYPVLVIDHRTVYAHRRSWEVFVGPIGEGLHVDHTCHNADATCPGGDDCPHRACVNPMHLEPVTPGVNVRRAIAQRQARLALAS